MEAQKGLVSIPKNHDEFDPHYFHPLLAKLSPQFLQFFDTLPRNVRQYFITRLKQTERWTSSKQKKDDFLESNLGHYKGMLQLALWMKETFPNISEGIDWEKIGKLILIHDMGELPPSIGDLPVDQYQGKGTKALREKHKAREAEATLTLLKRYLSKEKYKEAKELYEGYEHRTENDLEEQLVKMIDALQALLKGKEVIFPHHIQNIRKRKKEEKRKGKSGREKAKEALENIKNKVGRAGDTFLKQIEIIGDKGKKMGGF